MIMRGGFFRSAPISLIVFESITRDYFILFWFNMGMGEDLRVYLSHFQGKGEKLCLLIVISE